MVERCGCASGAFYEIRTQTFSPLLSVCVFLFFFLFNKNLIARRADFDCFLIQFASLSFPSFLIPVLELCMGDRVVESHHFAYSVRVLFSVSLSQLVFFFSFFFFFFFSFFFFLFFTSSLPRILIDFARFAPFALRSLLMVISPLRHSQPNIHGPRRRRTRSSSRNRNQGATAGCAISKKKKQNIKK